MDNISRKFARFSVQVRFEALSAEEVENLKLFILDWIGSAYAGSKERPVKIMSGLVKAFGRTPDSTIIPLNLKGPCLFAALVNGASSHVVEMDDLHRESVLHPAAAILPAVFAAAEREKVSGRNLIVGAMVGYEVGIRVALGVGKSHYRYWHTTGTCGTFGAAAGSGKVLELNEDQFVWALGSAGTQSSGLWEFLAESAMSKQLHAGKSAMNGLLSALLAKEGFTGASRILEGEKGFFKATSIDYDPQRCVEGLGQDFFFTRNSLKYYPSCGHTHSAIDAAIKATGGRAMGPEEIQEVRVFLYNEAIELLGEIRPITPYLSKFSLPFCVALAIGTGKVEREDFSQNRLQDPRIQRLMGLIKVLEDKELSSKYPRKWPAVAEIHTKGGKLLRGKSDYPKGDPENPLSEREVIEKFFSLTKGILPPAKANNIVEGVMSLEKVKDVSQLL